MDRPPPSSTSATDPAVKGILAGMTAPTPEPGPGPASPSSRTPAAPPNAEPTAAPVAAPVLGRVRPVRLRRVCAALATVVVLVFGLIAVLLRGTSEGVLFGPSDQAAMFGLGLVIATGILTLARPWLEADEQGLRIRNVIGRYDVPWDLVEAVTFRDGAPWASLELAGDETLSLMAVQAADHDRAVAAVRRLRALHRRYRAAA